MTRLRRPAHELRTAIDCMPLGTRRAMHDAVGRNPIIVGAYTDRDGGVCPMLAAHRNGGRTSFASFARAWDRYTRASAPRRASEREVRALLAMLAASIAAENEAAGGALGDAIADHRTIQARRARREEHAPPAARARPTGERDRSGELAGRRGWAWLRPFRRLDAYEQALAELEHEGRGTRDEGRDPALRA